MTIREHRASRRLGAVRFTCATATATATAPRRASRWPLLTMETVIIAIVAMLAHGLAG